MQTKDKTITDVVIFKATPEEVYDALMNTKKHKEFTQSECTISTKVGGKISAYDGYINGKNVELVPGKKIVQLWRDSSWPKDYFSTVTYEFKKTKDGCEMIFTQEGVPRKSTVNKNAWHKYYWQPMKEMFDVN